MSWKQRLLRHSTLISALEKIVCVALVVWGMVTNDLSLVFGGGVLLWWVNS